VKKGFQTLSLGIVGWLLVILGVLSYLGGLSYTFRVARKDLPEIGPVFTGLAGQFGSKPEGERDRVDISKLLEALAKACERLTKVLEAFGKLALGIQWAALGLVAIGFGAYLLSIPAAWSPSVNRLGIPTTSERTSIRSLLAVGLTTESYAGYGLLQLIRWQSSRSNDAWRRSRQVDHRGGNAPGASTSVEDEVDTSLQVAQHLLRGHWIGAAR